MKHAAPKAMAFALLLALAGCDRDEEKPRAQEPAPIASVVKALGLDAGELEPSVDPPAPAGDLEAELAAFTTVDACVAQRAAGDPAVGDALESIGYDTLVRDACRVLDAAKSRDAKRCGDILSSTLQARCQASVAELTEEPERCPFEIASHPELGRDAVCLALATKDARLCAAAIDRTARTTCEALAAHDPAPCKRLAMRAEQARCARDEQRWASVLPRAETDARAELPTSSKVQLTGDAEGGAGEAFAIDVSRGVVLLERLDGAHFTVGPMSRASLGFVAPSPAAPRTLALELAAPSELKKAHAVRAQLEVPGRSPMTLESLRAAALVVHLTNLEKRRGGAVELTVDGPLEDGVSVHVEVATFVRDIVSASAILGASRGGDPAGMR